MYNDKCGHTIEKGFTLPPFLTKLSNAEEINAFYSFAATNK